MGKRHFDGHWEKCSCGKINLYLSEAQKGCEDHNRKYEWECWVMRPYKNDPGNRCNYSNWYHYGHCRPGDSVGELPPCRRNGANNGVS